MAQTKTSQAWTLSTPELIDKVADTFENGDWDTKEGEQVIVAAMSRLRAYWDVLIIQSMTGTSSTSTSSGTLVSSVTGGPNKS